MESTNSSDELIKRREQLLAELKQTEQALLEAQAAKRQAAITRILAEIESAGLTYADLFPQGAKKGKQTAQKSRGAVPIKYRDSSSGQAWSGRGKQPRWLVAALEAGRSIEEFAV